MRRQTIFAAFVLAACAQKPEPAPDTPGPRPGVICTMEARSAIQVTILDQQGGRLPSGTNVRVVARLEGAAPYADTATVVASGDSTSIGLAHERAGSFTVSVSAPGYRPFTASDVRVEKTPDGCHVQTNRIVARLQR
jgi:hypothetical protein